MKKSMKCMDNCRMFICLPKFFPTSGELLDTLTVCLTFY